jgi:hypothetical protein
MKVLSVYRCVVIYYVGRCCVWMEIYILILSSSILKNFVNCCETEGIIIYS